MQHALDEVTVDRFRKLQLLDRDELVVDVSLADAARVQARWSESRACRSPGASVPKGAITESEPVRVSPSFTTSSPRPTDRGERLVEDLDVGGEVLVLLLEGLGDGAQAAEYGCTVMPRNCPCV